MIPRGFTAVQLGGKCGFLDGLGALVIGESR